MRGGLMAGAENGWLYVVELGEATGRQLEAMVATGLPFTCEEFAAFLIRDGLMRMEAERAAAAKRVPAPLPPEEPDDHIPF